MRQTPIWREHTGIDENALACNVSRLTAGEETDNVGDIFWFLPAVVNSEILPTGRARHT